MTAKPTKSRTQAHQHQQRQHRHQHQCQLQCQARSVKRVHQPVYLPCPLPGVGKSLNSAAPSKLPLALPPDVESSRRCHVPGSGVADSVPRGSGASDPRTDALLAPMLLTLLACESEQQHVLILVRNEGQSQLDEGHMWW